MSQKKENNAGDKPVNAPVLPDSPGENGGVSTAPAKDEKAAEYLDQLLRLKAEFDNFRKRTEKEKSEAFLWGKMDIILKLLPVYDVMLHAHAHILKIMSGDKAACGGPTEELCKGLEIIFKEFSKVFAAEDIRIMDVLGKPYDPMAHEVLGTVESGDCDDGTVVDELQKGFTVGNRVLRPARVRIAKKKETAEEK